MIMKWNSALEKYTAMGGAGLGLVLMAIMLYVFYLISTTCGYSLIDGKCQIVRVEQNAEND